MARKEAEANAFGNEQGPPNEGQEEEKKEEVV